MVRNRADAMAPPRKTDGGAAITGSPRAAGISPVRQAEVISSMNM
ncbi:MAG: hypothetical protein U0R19_02050 [Bryobacteraceae bacterium]